MKNATNLLEGSIFGRLTRLAMPIMMTAFVQMAYNLVDMIWIGGLGSGAVAAVGAAGIYLWIADSCTSVAKTGGQIKVAHSIGEGNEDKARSFAAGAFQMGVFIILICMAVVVCGHQLMVGVFQFTDEVIHNNAVSYLLITGTAGIFFSTVNQVFTGVYTGLGDSKSPFWTTAVGLVLNLILDPVLIFGVGPIPAMGVGGAAAATVLAQMLVVVIFLLYARRDTHLFCHVQIRRRPELPLLRELLRIGLPSAMQSMLFTLVSMVIARLIASWGDAAVAVQKVGSQIESISWMTADGFSAAVSSFVGQNYGAGNLQRAKKGYWTSLITIVGWGIFSSLLLIFCAAPIFRIFIPQESVLPLGVDYLVILGVSQIPMCVDIITAGAFAGFGHTLPPSLATTLLVASRIPMAMVLSRTALGLNGIWWSISITSILRGLVLLCLILIFFRRMAKKKKTTTSLSQ